MNGPLLRGVPVRRFVAGRGTLSSNCLSRGRSGSTTGISQILVVTRGIAAQNRSIHSVRDHAPIAPTAPKTARGYAAVTEASSDPYADVMNVAPKGPLEQYQQWVAMGRLKADEYQRSIVQVLEDLHNELATYSPPKVEHPHNGILLPQRTSLLDGLFGFNRKSQLPKATIIPRNIPKGLYLYGDVGSGKTMLMDMFYQTLPPNIKTKTRIHFHHFMQDVHKRLHVLKTKRGRDFDAIPFVGAELAEAGSVLCFDEFQCTDVADAMILRRLLESLMSHGVVLICTSNRHPDELYKNGIQRESFLPCIDMLKDSLRVINLDSPTDYRKIPRPPASVYRYPLDDVSEQHASKWFSYLGDPNEPPRPTSHQIWGRDVHVPMASGKAARFSFDELCGRPLSAADYLELTRRYKAFVVTGVPEMDFHTRDLARRFITFIDAVYESRAKLVLTLATHPGSLFNSKEEIEAGKDINTSMQSLIHEMGVDMQMLKNSSIYTGDEEKFAFARALSRLTEMESQEWIERPH